MLLRGIGNHQTHRFVNLDIDQNDGVTRDRILGVGHDAESPGLTERPESYRHWRPSGRATDLDIVYIVTVPSQESASRKLHKERLTHGGSGSNITFRREFP